MKYRTFSSFVCFLYFTSFFSVEAKVIEVTSGASDNQLNGNCSIIEAILSANTNSSVDNCVAGSIGSDTILLNSSTYSLFNVIDGRYGANGTPCIDSEVIVIGNGATIERVSDEDFRVFCVDVDGFLTLKDLTIAGGRAFGPSLNYQRGGGVMSVGSVEMENVIFKGNSAQEHGGAVLVNGGEAKLNSVHFSDNSANKGGAVRTDAGSDVKTINVIFENNTANYGGAVFANDSNLIIERSTFYQNEANYMGGGLYLSGSNASVIASNFKSNTTSEKGGGIRIDNASIVSVNRSTIENNSSIEMGGGIHVIKSELVLEKTTISNNNAIRGAGLYVDVAVAEIVNTTISNNISQIYGGGIYVDADVNLALYNSRIKLDSATIFENRALVGGGGLWMNPISKAQIKNSVIASNQGRDCLGPGLIESVNSNWYGDSSCSGVSNGDPHLFDLLNNGGDTRSHYPMPFSPLIDAVVDYSSCLSYDQLGNIRPFGITCDIGAVEYRPKLSLESMFYLLFDED